MSKKGATGSGESRGSEPGGCLLPLRRNWAPEMDRGPKRRTDGTEQSKRGREEEKEEKRLQKNLAEDQRRNSWRTGRDKKAPRHQEGREMSLHVAKPWKGRGRSCSPRGDPESLDNDSGHQPLYPACVSAVGLTLRTRDFNESK